MVKKIITFFIVNLLIFSGLPYVYAQNFNPKPLCLSPQLQLQTSDMISMCQSMYQHVNFMPQSEIALKGDPDYSGFLEKLSKQVGSADELMDYIKDKYDYKYGQAIKLLEAKEAQRPEGYQWVIMHEKEVMLISYCMGKILGFSEEHLVRIAIGCRFHDVGKCDIKSGIISDDRVFSDIMQFTYEQQEMIRNEIVEHSAKSCDTLKDCGINDPIMLSIALYHHANVDGSGYPDPVTRQQIPLEAKIARVADSFSAMLGFRPYNHRLKNSFASAVADIQENAYFLYGPRVVRVFLSLVDNGGDLTNHYKQLYKIPLKESQIFHELCKQAQNIQGVYPLAKVACGISRSWNEDPFCSATNTIGTHRHAEINLVLKVLEQKLSARGLYPEYREKLTRLEFLAYTEKINKSKEAMSLLKELSAWAGEPFKAKVIYVTLRPCGSCIEVFNALGISAVYYGSEHPDKNFIQAGKIAASDLSREQIKIIRAYFVNEGVIEPNDLFFAFCAKPGLETLSATINDWFLSDIKHNHSDKISIAAMQQKQQAFQAFIDQLLKGIDKDSDLAQINASLLLSKKLWENKLDVFQEFSLLNRNLKLNLLGPVLHLESGIVPDNRKIPEIMFIEQAI